MEDDHQSDEQDPHAHFFWQELAPVLVCYGITFIFGSVGNALIVYATYRNGRMQSVTNVFLASLAIADLLLIILCIPVKVILINKLIWCMVAIIRTSTTKCYIAIDNQFGLSRVLKFMTRFRC